MIKEGGWEVGRQVSNTQNLVARYEGRLVGWLVKRLSEDEKKVFIYMIFMRLVNEEQVQKGLRVNQAELREGEKREQKKL